MIFYILNYSFCWAWKVSFVTLFFCISYFIIADHTKQGPAALWRDFHKLEKWVHRNMTKFNSEEFKALHLGETTPWISMCWETPIWEVTWQKKRRVLVDAKLNVHLRPSRPMVSWGALGKVLPAGWGRPSFSPAQH